MSRTRVALVHLVKLTLVRHSLTALAGLALVFLVSGQLSPYRDLQAAQVAYTLCATAGLTFMAGLSGQVSVGQGALMAVGAYTTALLIGHLHWALAVVLLCSAAVAGTVGLVLAVAASRLRGVYLATATLALAVGLPALADYPGLSGALQGENGLTVNTSAPPAGLGPNFPLERWQAWVSGLCAVLTLWFLANLQRSRYGRLMRAAQDDESAAALSGVRIARLRVLAFVIAAACAGLGGGLLAWVNSLAAPGAFTLDLSIALLTAAILGGVGSLAGAVWGSLFLVVISSWTSGLSSSNQLPANVADNLPGAIYGVVLIVVMRGFPGGIQQGLRRLGARLARRVLISRRTEGGR
ncbi:branched-chain amino acid ABC transporter permease [Streptacidiphilus rugosus]|uniref:branched-chain amino acid ABC transporter permease n=1 Tax=Streptacidiphilus rugosus TaxID=405783 RepID=UPI0007C7285A|nr:branched-chain amino acid ABC transporter permease [Streptacidiphilus rugosus]